MFQAHPTPVGTRLWWLLANIVPVSFDMFVALLMHLAAFVFAEDDIDIGLQKLLGAIKEGKEGDACATISIAEALPPPALIDKLLPVKSTAKPSMAIEEKVKPKKPPLPKK
jgi:hypothetical protein